MMNSEGRCSQFKCRLKLSKYRQGIATSADHCDTVKDGFVRDKLLLETVLGQSNPSWFEQLTEQRLERKVTNKPGQHAVFDSPSTPTISQLINVSNLRVGSSPDFSYDSPMPSSYSNYRQSPVQTPDNWSDWKKPLLGLSPSPRQPTPNRSASSYPSIAAVQSLGVLADDSALFWTNSLATPPRDLSDMSSDLNTSATNQKELVRVLFSPGDNLDTTSDSVHLLDSTYEEDQPIDLQTDHSDKNQTDLSLSRELKPRPDSIDNSTDSISTLKVRNSEQKSLYLISESKPAFVTENISGFAEMSCESDTEEKGLMTLDIGVDKNLKESNIKCQSSESVRSNQVNQNCGDKRSASHSTSVKIEGKCLKANVGNIDDDSADSSANIQNTETVQVSPTFTQKCSRKCFKTKTTNRQKKGTRVSEMSVDEALSDFFDSPATAARKRRRNSDMSGRNHLDSLNSSQIVLNVNESEIRCSTPKERTHSLQSILSSKRSKSSSGKKVRFSENVKKYCIKSEYPSILKKRTDKTIDGIRPETKKVKFEEVILSYKENKTELGCDTGQKIGGQETSIDETGDCRIVKNSKTNKKKNETPNKHVSNDVSKLVEKRSMIVKSSDDKMGICDNLDGAGDGLRKSDTLADEFSQISPSSLNEMCSVADRTGSFIATDKDKSENVTATNVSDAEVAQINNTTEIKSDDKRLVNFTNKNRKQTAIKFVYPKSLIATSFQKKIFKYEENSQTEKSGLVTPVLASHIVSPKIEHEKDTKKDVKYESMEPQKQESETQEILVQKVLSSSKRKIDSKEMQDNSSVRKTLEYLETDSKNSDRLKKVSDDHTTLTNQISGPKQGFHCASGRAISLTSESLDKASRLFSEEGNTVDSISSCPYPHTTEPAVTLKTAENQSDMSRNNHKDSHSAIETSGREVKDTIDFSDEWAEDFYYDPSEPGSNPEQIESMQIDEDITKDSMPLVNDNKEVSQKNLSDSSESVKKVKIIENEMIVDKINLLETLKDKSYPEFQPSKSSIHTGPVLSTATHHDTEHSHHSDLASADNDKPAMPSVSVCELSGFKTASGKKLECSSEAMSKAESYMNEDGEDKVVKKYSSKQYKGISVVTKSFKSSVIQIVPKQQDHEAMKQDFSLSSQTLKPNTATGTLNAGFATASGKNLTLSDTHMKKARSVLGEILEENAGPNNVEIAVKETRGDSKNTSVAQSLKAEFENDLVSMPTDLDSMMEELKTVKNSRVNENLRQVEKEETKIPIKKPVITAAQNVPQGFRPFKRPRPCGNKSVLTGNKYPDSKVSDWGKTTTTIAKSLEPDQTPRNPASDQAPNCLPLRLKQISTDKSAQDTTDNSCLIISDKSKMKYRSETRKLEEQLDTEMANVTNKRTNENLITSSNIPDENCGDMYQGLSQMFADELDSSFESTNNSSYRPEKQVTTSAVVSIVGSKPTEVRPVQKMDMNVGSGKGGFATASGKSLSLSATSLLSAQRLFEGMEDSESSRPEKNISKLVTDGSSGNAYNSVASVQTISKGERPECIQNVQGKSNQLVVSQMNYYFSNKKTGNIQSSKTVGVLSKCDGCKEQSLSSSLCKSSLNTSIASMENDSVGRQEHMEDKAENELLSSVELDNMESVHVKRTNELSEMFGASQDKESMDQTNESKQLTNDKTSPTSQKNDDINSRNSVLNLQDDINIFQGGFQTASGKHIAVSEKAIEDSNTMMNDSNKKGFTANGHFGKTEDLNKAGRGTSDKDKISLENNTKTSRDEIHKELEFTREIVGAEITRGFEIAKGEAVNVSQSAIKDINQRLEQNIDKHGSALDVTKAQLQASKGLCGFQTASGKSVNISAESVKRARKVIDSELYDGQDSDILTNDVHDKDTVTSTKHITIDKEFSLCTTNVKPENMFQSASGKAEKTSDQALIVIKRKLEKIDYENSNFGETSFQNVSQFSTTTGKNANLSEQQVDLYKFPETECFFQTARGKKVDVSEQSLKLAKNQVNGNDENDCTFASKKLDDTIDNVNTANPFQTASGNVVRVSEKALTFAKKTLDDSSDNVKSFTSANLFQTASGNAVNISEKSLAFAQKTLDDTADTVKSSNSTNPFQTASGNVVKVSEKALAFAKKTLDDSSDNLTSFNSTNPFHTASGNVVKISDNALAFAKKTLDDNTDNLKFTSSANPFQTASGTVVKVCNKALEFAKKTLDNADDNVNLTNSSSPFQTASGTTVKVSEKALAFAKKTLDDGSDNINVTSFSNPFQTASGTAVKVSEKALAFAKKTLDDGSDNINVTSFSNPFQTASGTAVKVSEKALAFAKKTLDDGSDNINVTSFSNPFQTASGTAVKVSEKALAFAKKTLDDGSDNINVTSTSNPFQTASGTAVKVSEKALAFAKKTLDDGSDNINVTSFSNPFQTASGTAVKVSEKALAFAKKTLHDNGDNMKSFSSADAFQTASGRRVPVSDKALTLVKKTLDDTEQEELDLDNANALKSDDVLHEAVPEHTVVLAQNNLIDNSCDIREASKERPGKSNVITTEKDDIDNLRSTNSEKLTSEMDMDDFNTELLDLKKERDRQLKNRMSKSEETSEGAAVNFLLSRKDAKDLTGRGCSGLPMKRQKLEDGMERTFDAVLDRDSLKRKPVRTRPEGTTTDRRHPGYRPFIPVRSKILQKSTPTLESIEPAITPCGSKAGVSGSKPAFHTPYRSPGAGQQNTPVTSNKIKVTMPIFRTKSTMDEKPEKQNSETAEQSLQQEQIVMARRGVKVTENVAMETEQIEETKTINKGSGVFAKDYESGIKESNEVSVNIKPEEESRKAEDLDSDMASYSQDEEDVFYCNLVEARKHQGEIISNKGRVKPMAGRLFEMKQTGGRWRLKDLIRRNSNACAISLNKPCAASARQYRFFLDDHYSKHTAHVLVGDGAFLVPDDAGYAGKTEFYRAFLTLEGVEAKLISEAWLYNHYRWIVWKLAAYEVYLPALVGRCLTPEMMMLQLKYRYDREIDFAQRSAVRKIFERDDTASKRMVLCVAGIQHVSAEGVVVQAGSHVNHPYSKVVLELTDGWYSVKAHTDVPLTDLVHTGKVYTGQKICISGAEVTGGENACSPLEAPESVMLKLCCNSARPCSWDSPLGYQRDPRPLCVPLCGLYGEGGAVGVVDVVIVRKYPILYMEKLPGGGNMFRTSRCEEKVRQEFESRKEVDMQRLYQDIMKEVDKESRQDKQQGRITRSSRKWTQCEVEGMSTGQEIYEGLNSAQQPDSFQSYLSEHQLNMLYEYQRQMQEVKQAALNTRLQDAWSDRQESAPDRNVTPVLKFRISGCSKKDMDNSTSTILTVWRPAPEISDLQEGKRYRIYSLNSSSSRSKYTGHTVQLTATKQTKFQLMGVDENFLDNIYEPREVLWVSDVNRRKPAYGELDFVGLVVKVVAADAVESGKPCDTVYLADCQGSYLVIKIWSGFKSFGEDLFSVGSVLCCCNLMDKSLFRSQHLPTVEAPSEFTLLTKSPQNSGQRKAVERLNSVMKDKKSFFENLQTTLDDMLYGRPIPTEPKMTTPCRHTEVETPHGSRLLEDNIHSNVPENVEDSCKTPSRATVDKNEQESDGEGLESTDSSNVTPQSGSLKKQKSVYQAKMARLLSYSSPNCLSPMNTPVPRSVRKGFKPPAFKKV